MRLSPNAIGILIILSLAVVFGFFGDRIFGKDPRLDPQYQFEMHQPRVMDDGGKTIKKL